MTQTILIALRLALVLTICCLSMNRALVPPVRLDIYRGRLVETAEDQPDYTIRPLAKGRDPRIYNYPTIPRNKRQEINEMDKYDFSQFCRAARIGWPQCKLISFPWKSQQSKIDETISGGNIEKVFLYEAKDGNLDDQINNLRNQDPEVREDLMRDEFNVRFTRPATRQKRGTSISGAMSGHQAPWDPEDKPGVDILLSDDQYEKRMARFNSWGGKRSDGDSTATSLDKRSVPFSSWGGKRGPSSSDWDGNSGSAFFSWVEKRGPGFSSWGGKREPGFSSWGGKRSTAFSSWGGKREPEFSSLRGKRAQYFSGLDGKRDNTLSDEEEKRVPRFSSWGGKRNPPFSAWDEKEMTVNESSGKVFGDKDGFCPGDMIARITPTVSSTTDINLEKKEGGDEELVTVGKRVKISDWGDKRTSETQEPLGDPEEVPYHLTMEKRDVDFSPWGAKRGEAIGHLFSNWEGKRGRSHAKQSSSPPLRQNRRGADFYPWGGKRSKSTFFL